MKDIKTTLDLIDWTRLISQLIPQVQLIDAQTCPCLLACKLRLLKSAEELQCFRNTGALAEPASAHEVECPMPLLPTSSPSFSAFTLLEWSIGYFSHCYTYCHQFPTKEQCMVFCDSSKGSPLMTGKAWRQAGRPADCRLAARQERVNRNSRSPPFAPLPVAKLPPKGPPSPDLRWPASNCSHSSLRGHFTLKPQQWPVGTRSLQVWHLAKMHLLKGTSVITFLPHLL